MKTTQSFAIKWLVYVVLGSAMMFAIASPFKLPAGGATVASISLAAGTFNQSTGQ